MGEREGRDGWVACVLGVESLEADEAVRTFRTGGLTNKSLRGTDYWAALGPIVASGVKVRKRGFVTSMLAEIS